MDDLPCKGSLDKCFGVTIRPVTKVEQGSEKESKEPRAKILIIIPVSFSGLGPLRVLADGYPYYKDYQRRTRNISYRVVV